MGFEVELEFGGFFAVSESMGRIDSPRDKFRGVRDLGPIVFCQASLKIIGQFESEGARESFLKCLVEVGEASCGFLSSGAFAEQLLKNEKQCLDLFLNISHSA